MQHIEKLISETKFIQVEKAFIEQTEMFKNGLPEAKRLWWKYRDLYIRMDHICFEEEPLYVIETAENEYEAKHNMFEDSVLFPYFLSDKQILLEFQMLIDQEDEKR